MKGFYWMEHSEPEKSIEWKSWKQTHHVWLLTILSITLLLITNEFSTKGLRAYGPSFGGT